MPITISIITVVYNRAHSIERAIESVLSQTYPNIEFIIVDGKSTDGTQQIIEKYRARIAKFISEKDRGIYDALNKGISLATGDVVGVLHSDDVFYSSDTIQKIAQAFTDDPEIESVYGDVAFVKKDRPEKIVRYYSSAHFNPQKFALGYMPAHTSFFCKRECFVRLGGYSLNYPISADFDLLVRFLKIQGVNSKYLPLCTTYMTLGGKSTSGFKTTFDINRQFHSILKAHQIRSNYLMLYSRYFVKIWEFFNPKAKL